MKTDLRQLDFMPLTEARAHLSEHLRGLGGSRRRLVITVNGRPAAVVLAYADFVELASEPAGEEVVSLETWKADRPRRQRVRDAVLGLFDVDRLSRKGQKRYKQEVVRGLRR